MVTVLFTKRYSNYAKFDTDCYDQVRNALEFKGLNPVIAHPPCGSWSRMKGLCKHTTEVRNYAIWAARLIQLNGGILEHPAHSTLWKELNLPLPGQLPDQHGGFSISINQNWFGHPAKKRTWLYIVGTSPKDLPLIPISFDAIQFSISSSNRAKRRSNYLKEVPRKFRDYTPERLCEWLIATIQQIETARSADTKASAPSHVDY